MSGKPQTEGIIDTHVSPSSSLQPAPPLVTRNENGREGIVVSNQPQLADLIKEEYSSHVPPVTVVPDPPPVTPLHLLPPEPTWIDCPYCKKQAMTKITTEGSSMQMAMGLVLCLFCICLACAPCMCGCFENTHIHCSNCNTRVATIPHDGPIQVAPIVNGQQQLSAYR
ncbi:hypothetical protein F5Y06DRAFT_48470 [Hypoxylon sp. FL0890]|nr:hypothetical protein F5Y06DRAFT_48470 [Hypoxylon sp. FL0890]